MAINIFIPKFHTDEILEEIRVCLDRGWTGLGFKTIEFENAWKKYTNLPNAHFINSSTSGLHLAIHILKKEYGWSDGDEIITTPLTFVSPNHAILYERLKPVFADVDDYLCLDPGDIKNKISSKTRAVMFVGLGGNTGQYEKIHTICKENNLKLILDAAHMAGTRYSGRHVGYNADVTVFSFQAVKNLPTADSGMICFNNEEFDAIARQLSWLGISKDTYQRFNKDESSYKWRYDVPNIGFKYHGNSIMASIGLVQLKYLDEDNKRRNELAEYYTRLLEVNKKVKIVPVASNCVSSRHLFQILVENREQILTNFYNHEIYPGVHYWDNTEYPMYAEGRGKCNQAHKYSQQVVSLPLHLNLTQNDIDQVVDVLESALK